MTGWTISIRVSDMFKRRRQSKTYTYYIPTRLVNEILLLRAAVSDACPDSELMSMSAVVTRGLRAYRRRLIAKCEDLDIPVTQVLQCN